MTKIVKAIQDGTVHHLLDEEFGDRELADDNDSRGDAEA